MNKKFNKKDFIANFIFIITFLIIYLFLTKNNHLFASTIDFKYQHYLIPEYFRTLFYHTHDLFPDFALNLGSGQNIYYLSYYGLFNPYILLSYLFPHLKMINYLITSNCIIVLATTSLFYFFLRKHQYNEKTSFIVAFLLLTSGPLIFHAKRHIMFINYFPFLILGLYGIDNYIKNKKTTLLTLSIILIILSSYYFSIPALITLYLYSLYQYLKQEKNITLKKIFQHTLKISIPFLIGIMITTILTLPTFYTLLTGRTTSQTTITLKELLTPSLTKNLFYSPYSIGLSLISLISLIYFTLKGKKETKFLAITCLLITIFPIFNYILNGTLYINAKALIPFSPLILILVANFLSKYLTEKITKKQILLITYILISSFTICLYTNHNDKLMKKEDIDNLEYNTTNQLIEEITKKDQDFYRINTEALQESGINKVTNIKERKTTIYSSTSNQNYTQTYNHILNNPIPNRNKFMIAPSNNIFSQILLGEKYILTKEKLGLDYQLIQSKNNINLYKNPLALPLGYATNQTIDTTTFKNTPYPSNIISLLTTIPIPNAQNKKEISTILAQKLNYTIINQNNIEIIPNNKSIIINAQKNAHLQIQLEENMKNKILLLSFHNAYNPNKDLSITINNIKNKLTSKSWKYFNNNTTFHYVICDTNILDITFTEGTYNLENLETYIIDYDTIKNIKNNINEFKINNTSTKGDTIKGTIQVTEDNSYFTISIPYDKGFQIKVDNKITPYQKTGFNFISFPISKGKHHIAITYQAPFKKISLLISATGILLWIMKIIQKKR